jgi:class 3 adenylate cyclase/tetratricopeptide (TPR) repeat protein
MHCGEAMHEAMPEPHRVPGAYTPPHLARKILTSRSALEGERKQVTVFFADVKGSVAISQQIDPERWHSILDRFFTILAKGVHRFEGTVNQFTGDGIMALFGAPIAHEDHAQRACYTALHLKEELRRYADELRRSEGLNFSVRMGLNSGEVVVGKIGDDLRMDYTAQGYTVGLAARVQEVAPPNCTYLGPSTSSLVRGFFESRPVGRFDIKGVIRPVALSELLGVGEFRSRLDLSRARGFSRFLGREDEMQNLESALDAALGGEAQLVAFVAEAGVGKSRLAYEFLDRCRARGIPCTRTNGVAHGRDVPLLPILELYREALGVGEHDSTQEAREKIAGRALLLDPELADSLPLVFDFLGVPDPERPAPDLSPEERQRRLVDFDVRYSVARSQREPMVSLYEDLHWMDSASLSWLAALVERAAETRTLIIVNFRPEFLARWEAEANVSARRLAPLGSELAGELMDSLIGSDKALTDLKHKIHAHTLGNPFFIEEVVRSLVEEGKLEGDPGQYRMTGRLPDVEIPTSVHSLLAARMDQLPEWEKLVLQTAAVIGRRIPRKILEDIVGRSTEELDSAFSVLIEREFLIEVSLYPEARYEFFHPLTREVAYLTQLGSRRTRTHEAVARAIESIDVERLDERAALLAHHYSAAGDLFESARWHHEAAGWLKSQDLASAVQHWRSARKQLALLEEKAPLDDSGIDLGLRVRIECLDAGVRSGMPQGEASEIMSEGRILAERVGDRERLCLLLVAYGNCCIFGAEFERGLSALREAEEVAEAAGSSELLINVIVTAAWSVLARGRLQEALHQNSRALEALEDLQVFDEKGQSGSFVLAASTRAALYSMRAGILRYLGRNEEARLAGDRVAEFGEDEDRSEWVAIIHGMISEWNAEVGEVDTALNHAHRFVAIGENSNNANTLIGGLQALSRAHVAKGEWERAIEVAEECLRKLRDAGILHAEIGVLCCLALAHLAAGNDEKGLRVAREAIRLAPDREGLHEIEGQILVARGLRKLYGKAAVGEIEDALVRASELIDETGAQNFRGDLHREAAQVAILRGETDVARRELERARLAFEERGARVLTADAIKGARRLDEKPTL